MTYSGLSFNPSQGPSPISTFSGVRRSERRWWNPPLSYPPPDELTKKFLEKLTPSCSLNRSSEPGETARVPRRRTPGPRPKSCLWLGRRPCGPTRKRMSKHHMLPRLGGSQSTRDGDDGQQRPSERACGWCTPRARLAPHLREAEAERNQEHGRHHVEGA